MGKVLITTLGCKVNQADSESIAAAYISKGFSLVKKGERPDVCIVNTCTVTAKADKECRGEIRKLKKLYPMAKVIVTGCYANVSADELQKMPEADEVVGTLPLVLSLSKDETLMVRQAHHERAKKSRPQLKIQDGCNNFCAYCIVPYARGRSRSVPPEEVVSRVSELRDAGFKEVVLTGIHVGGYGADLEPKTTLVELLRGLCHSEPEGRRIPQDPSLSLRMTSDSTHNDTHFRIRLSSIDPDEWDDAIMDHVCPHFHIPLQSGDDEILRAMGRKYTTEDYRKLIEGIAIRGSQRSDIRSQIFPTSDLRPLASSPAIGADVIVGFPGETDDHFERTKNFVSSLPLTYLHVFPYSRRKLTAAANLKETVPDPVKAERADILRKISEKKRFDFYKSFIGKTVRVVVEMKRDRRTGLLKGVSENYIPVLFEGDDRLMAKIVTVEIEGVNGDHVTGNHILGSGLTS
ncbi:MAG: tRNA (N(6)-L-threonylcarbamoyladenosine(37)-C(2))-methylthiotransferase MtaB [Deltaproteobacteria bacterium CG11_big_fil_rev_8_21_14_0_20_49_13]|nr:MAG: tRNA (N(6)-L-threonylcarbamoyladenosine(37)-C(2))-methylthiotransferase MtaB [Deltaproteobacteria bacterium CG11_big_fil_rev_8_21_14_0_20_49_13]